MAAPAAVLREGDRLLVERVGDRAQAARPDERHVGGQHEPAGGAGVDRHARGDRVAHTPPGLGTQVDDDHVLGSDQALRFVDQCLGDDEHDRHLGSNRIAQGAHKHAVTAELLAELVARPAIPAPCASGQHDDGRFIFHGRMARDFPETAH